MAEFDRQTRIWQVLGLGDAGRQLLYKHGYDVGDGFVDVLSQYQSLEEAHRAGRLRELPLLLDELAEVSRSRAQRPSSRRGASKKN